MKKTKRMEAKKTFLFSFLVLLSSLSHSQDLAFEWAKTLGEEGPNTSRLQTIDDFGNIYLVGAFAGKVDFDPGPDSFYLESKRDKDYLLKLDMRVLSYDASIQ